MHVFSAGIESTAEYERPKEECHPGVNIAKIFAAKIITNGSSTTTQRSSSPLSPPSYYLWSRPPFVLHVLRRGNYMNILEQEVELPSGASC